MGSYLGSKGPKNHQKSQKIDYFSHIMAIRAISSIHWIKFLFGTHMIECPKDKIVIHRVSGEGYWVPPGLQRAQKSSKIAQNWLFSHILGIRAISPIHWIQFLIVTYRIECPKDKIVIHSEGYGSHLDAKGPKNHQKSHKNWPFFTHNGH